MQQPWTDISVRTTSPNCSFHSSPQRPQVLTIYKQESPATEILQQIGRYEILKRIAAGGEGTVYRARDTVLDRVVAVKIINWAIANDYGLP